MIYIDPKGKRCEDSSSYMNLREDGRVERICAHGVGHPIGHIKKWEEWMEIHGCEGCCAGWYK